MANGRGPPAPRHTERPQGAFRRASRPRGRPGHGHPRPGPEPAAGSAVREAPAGRIAGRAEGRDRRAVKAVPALWDVRAPAIPALLRGGWSVLQSVPGRADCGLDSRLSNGAAA